MKEDRRFVPESSSKKRVTVIVDHKAQERKAKLSHYCPYSKSKNKFGKSILDKLFS